MSIEEKVFGKTRIQINRLVPYGFKQEENAFVYKQKLIDGFTLKVVYDKAIRAEVIDEELTFNT